MGSKHNLIQTSKTIVRGLCIALFLTAGWYHFARPDLFDHAMPANIPWHFPIIYASGVCELFAVVGLAVPKFRAITGKLLLWFLLAVFPVNINMAINSGQFPNIPAWLLWVRLPMQFVLIAVILWCTGMNAGNETVVGRPPD